MSNSLLTHFLMVGASGLIEALKRDNLDQRSVAEHLMLLAKVRIRDYNGHVALLSRYVGCCTFPTLTLYVSLYLGYVFTL